MTQPQTRAGSELTYNTHRCPDVQMFNVYISTWNWNMCLSKHVILSTRIGSIRVGMLGIRECVYVFQTAQTGWRAVCLYSYNSNDIWVVSNLHWGLTCCVKGWRRMFSMPILMTFKMRCSFWLIYLLKIIPGHLDSNSWSLLSNILHIIWSIT